MSRSMRPSGGGNQCSLAKKRKISRSPSQKLGIETPARATRSVSLANRLLGRVPGSNACGDGPQDAHEQRIGRDVPEWLADAHEYLSGRGYRCNARRPDYPRRGCPGSSRIAARAADLTPSPSPCCPASAGYAVCPPAGIPDPHKVRDGEGNHGNQEQGNYQKTKPLGEKDAPFLQRFQHVGVPCLRTDDRSSVRARRDDAPRSNSCRVVQATAYFR